MSGSSPGRHENLQSSAELSWQLQVASEQGRAQFISCWGLSSLKSRSFQRKWDNKVEISLCLHISECVCVFPLLKALAVMPVYCRVMSSDWRMVLLYIISDEGEDYPRRFLVGFRQLQGLIVVKVHILIYFWVQWLKYYYLSRNSSLWRYVDFKAYSNP